MKLTNKILLVFLILLVLLVTAYKIVFDSKVELIPNPFDKKTFYISKVYGLESNKSDSFELKGRFLVYFIQNDTAKVIIEGPDNLVNKYLSVERHGDRFSIISKIDLSKYSQYISVSCFVNDLRSVDASGGVIVSINEFVGDSLNITAEDSSLFNIRPCKYFQTNIIEKNNSTVMMSKTKNASIHLYDESNLLLTLDGGEVNGSIGAGTDFGLDGVVKKNSVDEGKNTISRKEK